MKNFFPSQCIYIQWDLRLLQISNYQHLLFFAFLNVIAFFSRKVMYFVQAYMGQRCLVILGLRLWKHGKPHLDLMKMLTCVNWRSQIFVLDGTLSSLPRGGLEYIPFLGEIVKNGYLMTYIRDYAEIHQILFMLFLGRHYVCMGPSMEAISYDFSLSMKYKQKIFSGKGRVSFLFPFCDIL